MQEEKKKRSHSRHGPSSLDSLSKCIRFKYFDQDEDAASEGTLLHKAAETGDMAGLDEEQALAATGVKQYGDAIVASLPGCIDRKELKETLEDLTFGTPDRVIIHVERGIVHVLDYKFVRLEADHQFQVKTYMAAVLERLAKEGITITQATGHVLSPRLRDKVKEYDYDPATHVAKVRQEIEELYERINDPFNAPTPNEDTCPKCARSSKCPAMGNAMVQLSHGCGLPMPSQFAPDALVSLRDRAIAQVLACVAETWAKQMKKANNEFVFSQDMDIPGFARRTRSTGLRVLPECIETALSALEAIGIPHDMLLQHCNITLGELGKSYAAASGLPEGTVKQQIQDALQGLAESGTAKFLQKEKRISDEALLQSL